jgi:peroxiredoxin
MGFFTGELGSFSPGPDPGEAAPDFILRTPDGKTKVKLSAYRGKQPVVLIFGNFT